MAFVIAQIVDRIISKRGERMGEFVARGQLSPAMQTRLRLIRRLVYALILVIGLAVAASQIDGVSGIAKGILASSALLGLVLGFAARQTLANGIAGILLAVTQPIRIGDLVTFEEESGVVEDMKLTYTYIRLDDGRRLIVPNERLAQSSVVNHTILDPRVQVEVSVWLPLDADLDKAMELIRNEDDRRRRIGGGGGQGGRAAERHDLGVGPLRARKDRRGTAAPLASPPAGARTILNRGLSVVRRRT